MCVYVYVCVRAFGHVGAKCDPIVLSKQRLSFFLFLQGEGGLTFEFAPIHFGFSVPDDPLLVLVFVSGGRTPSHFGFPKL